MRKFPIVLIITFFCLSVYSYRNSDKFRKLIYTGILATSIVFSQVLESNSKGIDGVEGFTSEQNRHTIKRSNLFGNRSRSGSGKKPNKNNNDPEIPKYKKPESVEITKKRVYEIKKYVRDLEKETDDDIKKFRVYESYRLNLNLKKVNRDSFKNKRSTNDLRDVKQKLAAGIHPMKIGQEPRNLGNNFFYLRKSNSRIIIKWDEISGNSDIIGFCVRSNRKNMRKLVVVVNSQYDTKVKINPKAY